MSIRKRIAYKEREVGELARDVDDELRRLKAALAALEARVANTNAGPIGSDDVTNESGVTGTTVSDALDTLEASIPSPYTDEQAQDAVGGIVLPSSGPVRLTYSDATPSITVAVDDFVGDSGSGGTKGLVPAPSSGDAAAGKFLKANGTWAAPTTGTTVSIWMPDAPPASPSAYDDEFTAGSLDAKWSEFDHGNDITVAMDTTRQMVKFTCIGSSGRVAGILQSPPSGEFAIYLKLGASTGLNDPNPGILVTEGTTNTSDLIISYTAFYRSTPGGFAIAKFSAYNAFSSILGSGSQFLQAEYQRMRFPNNGTFAYDTSSNGVNWFNVATVNPGFTLGKIGMGVNMDNGATSYANFAFFRVITGTGSSAFEANHIGRLVSVAA